MRWIQGIRITDFRSLSKVDVSGFEDVVPIVGVNGSGKSNLLRALNVFFNDLVEGDEELELARDFREPGRKRRQEIRIELDLAYGSQMRKELREPIDRFAGGADIVTIRRRWFRDPLTRGQAHELAMGPQGGALTVVPPADEHVVYRLFAAVPFRYLPNHVHPSQVLRDEEDGIRRILFERLGKSRDFSDDQIRKIQEASQQLMRPIAERMLSATGQVQEVELAVPDDWRDLLWAFGLRLRTGQTESYEALMHGSGVQSVLAYSILQMLDTSFRSSFGWKKGGIWAVEEPESFLHADLQASLARNFIEYATDSPLQILLSTHSTAFLGTADTGIAVSGPGTVSEVAVEPRPRLVGLATASGIAPFGHPLHTGPLKPLLIVEGKDDRALVARAYEASPDPCPYEIVSMQDLEPDLSGGVDQIITYLKHNRSALRARPVRSPVVVLLDWEVTTAKVGQAQRVLNDHPSSVAAKLPPDTRNAELSSSFVGIEGFLSTAFVEELAHASLLQLKMPGPGSRVTWRYDVDRSALAEAKSLIHRRLAERGNVGDIAPLIDQVPFISRLLLPQQSLPVMREGDFA